MIGIHIFVAILYVLVGTVLSAPYCLLVGWSHDHFTTIVVIGPIVLLFGAFLTILARIIVLGGRTRIKISLRNIFGRNESNSTDIASAARKAFWVWLMCILMPIICRVTADVLKHHGHEEVAMTIYEYRYASPIFLLVGGVVVIFLLAWLEPLWKSFKRALLI